MPDVNGNYFALARKEGGIREEPFGRLRVDILRRMSNDSSPREHSSFSRVSNDQAMVFYSTGTILRCKSNGKEAYGQRSTAGSFGVEQESSSRSQRPMQEQVCAFPVGRAGAPPSRDRGGLRCHFGRLQTRQARL
jgi:hypothetical protein